MDEEEQQNFEKQIGVEPSPDGQTLVETEEQAPPTSKPSHKKLIIGIIAVFLLVAGSAGAYFYLNQRGDEVAISVPPAPIEEEIPALPDISHLSEEELTALWANGERCYGESFRAPDPTPLLEYGLEYGLHLNFVRVTFTRDVTCEDVERIAILLDAKINGRVIEYNISEFKLSTETLEDLEEAIMKIEKLKDPKIQKVRKVIRYDIEEF